MKLTLSAPLLFIAALATVTGCTTHERVVVHDRPEVVRVAPPPRPVVEEKVVVRP